MRNPDLTFYDDIDKFAREVVNVVLQQKTDANGDIQPPFLYWMIGLLTGMVGLFRSIRLLTDHDQLGEAVMLHRSLWEAFVNMHYVLHDPRQSDKLYLLYAYDSIEDTCQEIDIVAKHQNRPISELCRDNPGVARRFRARESAHRRRPSSEHEQHRRSSELGGLRSKVRQLANDASNRTFTPSEQRAIKLLAEAYLHGRQGASEPGTFKGISMKEKETSLEVDSEALRAMNYTRLRANYHVHLGGRWIETLLLHQSGQSWIPTFGAKKEPWLARSLCRTASTFLFVACQSIIEAFYISGYSETLERLHERLLSLPKTGAEDSNSETEGATECQFQPNPSRNK